LFKVNKKYLREFSILFLPSSSLYFNLKRVGFLNSLAE